MNLADAMERAQVLDFELQKQLVPLMRDMVPLPGEEAGWCWQLAMVAWLAAGLAVRLAGHVTLARCMQLAPTAT